MRNMNFLHFLLGSSTTKPPASPIIDWPHWTVSSELREEAIIEYDDSRKYAARWLNGTSKKEDLCFDAWEKKL